MTIYMMRHETVQLDASSLNLWTQVQQQIAVMSYFTYLPGSSRASHVRNQKHEASCHYCSDRNTGPALSKPSSDELRACLILQG